MLLSDYLKLRGVSQRKFADELGVSAVSVTRYIKGDRLPHPWVMQRISEVTSGAVTPDDLIRFLKPKRFVEPRQVRDRKHKAGLVTRQEG